MTAAKKAAPLPSFRSIQLDILAEARKHTALLEVLAKQGDRAAQERAAESERARQRDLIFSTPPTPVS